MKKAKLYNVLRHTRGGTPVRIATGLTKAGAERAVMQNMKKYAAPWKFNWVVEPAKA